MGLFQRGWSISHCQTVFESVLREVFGPPHTQPRRSTFRRRSLSTYLTDSIYPTDRVNRALQDVFGEEELVDDPLSFAAQRGIKWALTATTVPGTERRLINNYNGFGHRSPRCGRWSTRSTFEPNDTDAGRQTIFPWQWRTRDEVFGCGKGQWDFTADVVGMC